MPLAPAAPLLTLCYAVMRLSYDKMLNMLLVTCSGSPVTCEVSWAGNTVVGTQRTTVCC